MKVHAVMAVILVQNIERALRFYRDILGFTVQDEREEWVVFREGIALYMTPEPLPEVNLNLNAVMITLIVDDVRAAFKELTQKGVAFFQAPTEESGRWFAAFRDTENNILRMVQD